MQPTFDSTLLKTLIENMPGHVFWKDKDLKFLGCNLSQAKQLGFDSIEKVVGLSSIDAIDRNLPLAQRQSLAKAIDDADKIILSTGKEAFFEEPIVLASGETAMYLSHKVPLRDEHENIIGILGIAVEITEQIKKLNELRLQKEKAEEQAATAQLYAASLAHEIRTPMSTVSLSANLLEDTLPKMLENLPEDKKVLRPHEKEGLETVAQKLSMSVKSANAFSKMMLVKTNLNELQPELIKMSVGQLIQYTIKNYPFMNADTSIVNFDLNNDFSAHIDPTLIEHVFLNLLKNGIYFAEEKGDGELFIWMENNPKENIVHVKDTGLGISEEDLPNIFKPFFTKGCHGTGVGLAFCDKVMKEHGGTIECDSVLGEYTHFTLTFPKNKAGAKK